MGQGYLALVLHAHLPFLQRTDSGNSLQERWLYEAVLESYIPLLMTFRRLWRDGVPFRATLSFSPTLLGMLADPRYRGGVARHLEKLLDLAEREVERTRGSGEEAVARWYRSRFEEISRFLWQEVDGDILRGFRELAREGCLELITTAATHGYLPLVRSRRAAKAQIETGLQEFSRIMGMRPRGVWLPECGFTPGLDELLAAAGVRYFFTESHVIEHARPAPPAGVYRPVLTPAGVAAFGRDRESSRQVWDRLEGYPGDHAYREFYRDIGWDLPLEAVGPYVLDGGVRCDTGLKYHRITGPGPDKALYDPLLAAQRVREHASHFVSAKLAQVKALAAAGIAQPIVVAPYDAELFGHWWFEGPQWVEEVFRIMAGRPGLEAITPAAYLDRHPAGPVVHLSMGSWGAGGYNEVWLNGANDWLYPRLHKAEERMIGLARAHPKATGLLERALNQAARELLLAQSSDWAFMITMGSAADYAAARAAQHLDGFEELYRAIVSWSLREDRVAQLEERDWVFPQIDYRIYAGGAHGALDPADAPLVRPSSRLVRRMLSRGDRPPRRILMLSWEYPPFVVGGLGHHTAGLARALAARGHAVTVVTAVHPEAAPLERQGLVEVRRVGPPPRTDDDFLGWVYGFNEAVVREAAALMEEAPYDLIHAHDWLVGPAAAALKQRFDVPLVATIHATEHGRNGGLFTPLQRAIHREEWRLTHEAWRVIACSRYMAEEVSRLFATPPEKLAVIPNAVDARHFGASFMGGQARETLGLEGPTILFVGRLVPEKGVQVLLRAMPAVLERHPAARCLIAGRGPFHETLTALARELGVAERVRFLGFVDEARKQALLHGATVVVVPSLYEPFGIIALEAMAAGTPVIASATGGLAEIVDHRLTGIMVPPGDPDALAEAIGEVLTHETLAQGLGARAALKVREQFSWHAVAVKTEDLYEEVLVQLAMGRACVDAASPGAGKRLLAGYAG